MGNIVMAQRLDRIKQIMKGVEQMMKTMEQIIKMMSNTTNGCSDVILAVCRQR